MSKKNKKEEITIKTKAIGEIMPENYVEYGRAVNTSRAIPFLLDGLKPVYRRIIYTLNKMSNQYHLTSNVQGEVMKIHPHNPDHQVEPISMMCHYGILSTQTNQGALTLYGGHEPPSAPRYTDVKLSDKLRNILQYAMKEVPMIETDTGYVEPSCIPFPVPMILLMDKMSSIGVGVGAQYPSFSMESMIDAYLSNDPSKLKYRGKVHIDHERSTLKSLWKTGRGRVVYYPDVYVKGRSVYVECTPGLIDFPYNWNESTEVGRQFNDLKNSGKILINDLSDRENEGLLEISIGKRVSTVDIEWLEQVIRKQVEHTLTYTLFVSNGDYVHQISLKDWIHTCYSNYCDLTNKGLDKLIKDLNWEKRIYEALPLVAKELSRDNNLTDEQMSKSLKLDINLISECTSKPLSMIRKGSHDAQIDRINKRIKELKSVKPENLIKDNML